MRAVKVSGGGRRTVPAPLGEPPLLVRAGAVFGLLDAAVGTLSPYRGAGVVRSVDRASSLHIVAIPRGRGMRRLGHGATARYAEGDGRLVLKLGAERRMRWDVEISLGALRHGFRPGRVLLDGVALSRTRWRFDSRSGVVGLRARGRTADITIVSR